MKLSDIRRIAAAATEGPWFRVIGRTGNGTARSQEEQIKSDANGYGIVMLEHDGSEEGNANAELLTTMSPNTVLGMLDTIDLLCGELMATQSQVTAERRNRIDTVLTMVRERTIQ